MEGFRMNFDEIKLFSCKCRFGKNPALASTGARFLRFRKTKNRQKISKKSVQNVMWRMMLENIVKKLLRARIWHSGTRPGQSGSIPRAAQDDPESWARLGETLLITLLGAFGLALGAPKCFFSIFNRFFLDICWIFVRLLGDFPCFSQGVGGMAEPFKF